MDFPLQDIGQLAPGQIKTLDRLVRKGVLVKGREYWHGWGNGSVGAGPKKTTWRRAS